MTISFPSLVPLSTLAEKSAGELKPRIGRLFAEMVSTRALGERLVVAGSASFPDAAAQQVLGAVAVVARSTDPVQTKSFALQMGQSLVQVAEEGWNMAQGLSELQQFSCELSKAAAPRRQIAAPVCGA